uniref:bacteriophage Gp15 family protein n=1 Tax=Sporofaciens musculi TaxID=2681861 RepID=UPI00257081ED
MKEDFITGKLPETVTIDGAEYPIRSDFRVGMQLDRIWGSGMDERDKVIQLLGMYYPRIPANVPEAVSRMLWFYRCGEPEEREEDGNGGRTRYQRRTSKEPAYSFAQDAPYIYAAFKEQYGIDLTDARMHWWKFMALFESLNEDTKMSRIMYYRKVSTAGLPR